MKIIQPRLNYSLDLFHILKSFKDIFFEIKPCKTLSALYPHKNTFFFNHARSGLVQILKLLPENSVVGVQPFTCPTVLESIIHAGCRILFIDIDEHLVIDKEKLRQNANKIDAVIVTHTFGFVVSIEQIREVVGNKVIIEDCAHAFLSKDKKDYSGKKGDFSIFSFGFGKFVSALKGGFVLINNENYLSEFTDKYSLLSKYGVVAELKNWVLSVIISVLHIPFLYTFITKNIKKTSTNYVRNDFSDVKKAYNSSLSVFFSLLIDINVLLEKQKNNAKELLSAVQKNNNFQAYYNPDYENCFMLPAFIRQPDKFIQQALQKGIEVGKHFYRSKYAITSFGYEKGACPSYEKLIENLITLPTHYKYPKKKIKILSKIIENYSNE